VSEADRRPIAARGSRFAQALARALLATRVSPNQVSSAGIVFAAAGAAAFAFAAGRPWLWLLGALGVQARLMCNLLDGMVAVEGGRGGPTGVLYNELPDRVEDSLLLWGFGVGVGVPQLGLAAAVLAVGTAYVRAVGASLGLGQDFSGPFAKQHRMAALTGGAVLALADAWAGWRLGLGEAVLWVVTLGTSFTCLRRTARIARRLREGDRV